MAAKKIIWDQESLGEALGQKIDAEIKANGVSIDTRKVRKGNLFIAIRGERFNGNDFAAEAIKKGASVCIVDEISGAAKKYKKQLIVVEDTMQALRQLAKYSRERIPGKIIGITGSVGKTSTKEMLKIALENQGKVFATEGNFNNHYGLPLSLANMPEDTEYGIFEMGMTSSGEISNLSLLARPNISIITAIEAVHLEFFTSVAGIAAAKAEIYDGMDEDGIAIINIDNPYSQILIERAQQKKLKIVTFGEVNKCDFRLVSYGIKQEHACITLDHHSKEYAYQISALGKHLAFNSLAVLAAVHEGGAELEYAAHHLMNFKAQKGRGEIIHVANGNYTVIDDSYNASPVSVKAALENLKFYKNDNHRVVAVLGNMVQLGPQSEEMHVGLCKDIANQNIDKVYTVGDDMKKLFDKLPDELKGAHADSAAEMLEIISQEIQEGDVLLVKGSNVMKMDIIVDNIAH